jgi:hypothetical protein
MPTSPKSRKTTRGSTLAQQTEKLPHERDETPAAGAPARDVIRQAESDVRDGQVDTDNYSRMREVTSPAVDAGKLRRQSK